MQETVNTHPDVADCVASEGTLHVVPYFHFRAHAGLQALYENVAGSETPEDLAPFSLVDESVLHTYLTGKGYDGPTIPVTLMTEIQLADKFLSGAALHERLALRDIIAAVFAAVDVDGDGEITMEEFAAWAERQDIGIDARKAFTAVDTADVGALKNFGMYVPAACSQKHLLRSFSYARPEPGWANARFVQTKQTHVCRHKRRFLSASIVR